MAKKYKPIDEVASNFATGVSDEAAKEKWATNAAASVDYYRENFAPVYNTQIQCGAEVKSKGLAGYEALKAYADCMYRRRGKKGA
ncbi:hypothetical protein DRP04_01730 [Archaeoglobales archaeon]|nr:MAG: hypothetical protein DRP04_01730 [Archaeoglobales archaeon]